ncbi:hypothetical protein HNP86_000041 [Methanococcus maripaludis]|uniref:Glycosyltransferase RgtA/B/C/D-like domain-containing protein n=1 Tax=Methanococcus maripaludis TaxID=39152 RepID=A0A7J9NQH1_METMI|nr:DUF6541 family protein [Methanococcus maripaludis]MBA2849910.1 hypothetical protein [Methanococcus maripaludis]
MDLIYLSIVLILIYLINPLKNEEKLLTTPFLSISYIIFLSYVMSVLGISLIKIYYIIPLIFLAIVFSKRISFKNIKLNKISIFFVILISLLAVFEGYMIFPENPLNKTDTQYHSYKSQAIIEEKSLFYTTSEIPYVNYVKYPSGFHSLVYFISNNVNDIPDAFNFLMYFMLVLMVIGFYLIGESIKPSLGYFTAPFVMAGSVFYGIIYVLYPNYLAYSLFLISVFFLIKYSKSRDTNYLYLFSLVLFAMIYTHPFPVLMLILFILSITIFEISNKNYNVIKNYFIFSVIPAVASLLLISKRMSKDIVSYGKSSNVLSEPVNIIIHNIFAGFGIFYLFIKHPIYTLALDNGFTFLISLFFTYLFIIGLYSIFKHKMYSLILFPVLLLLVLINSEFIHINIPFFNKMYASNRMMYNVQVIMPIFYGFGVYSILNTLKKRTFKLGFIILTSFVIFSSAYMNYQIIPDYLKEQYVVSEADLNAFEWINLNNISNETFLNFGEDAGQFLPIYTSNKPVFYYSKFSSGDFSIGNNTIYELAKFIDGNDQYNYTKVCKMNNIKYIYVSGVLGELCSDFFKDMAYFKILYGKDNVYIVEVI